MATLELARLVLWTAIVGAAVVAGVAVGSTLHTREHPHDPLVVGPSTIIASAYTYYNAHGRYPPDGRVRAWDGPRTAWDEVLIANDRCSGGGAFLFTHLRGTLRIACESDDRVFVEVKAWGDR